MAGEESLPYIKIINAVKLLRLNIKKLELEQRMGIRVIQNLEVFTDLTILYLQHVTTDFGFRMKESNQKGNFWIV